MTEPLFPDQVPGAHAPVPQPPSWIELGRGPVPILFLHGLGFDGRVFQGQLRHFGLDLEGDPAAGAGFRALSWTMPGHGGPTALPDLAWSQAVASLARMMDAAGLDAAHLVGHSLGGMLIQEFALVHPERLLSATLMQTSPNFGSADGRFQAKFLAERLQPLEEGRSLADLAPTLIAQMLGPSAPEQAYRLALDCHRTVPDRAFRAGLSLLVGFDRRDALARFPCPALLIAGAEDPLAPPAMMTRMAERMPDARIVTLPECGHCAMLEQPDLLNAALLAFLTREPQPMTGGR